MLVKTVLDAATLTGLVAGISWVAANDPSSNALNDVKFTSVMAGSIALKQYLEAQKILPDNV